jgi:hypothetical protein
LKSGCKGNSDFIVITITIRIESRKIGWKVIQVLKKLSGRDSGSGVEKRVRKGNVVYEISHITP